MIYLGMGTGRCGTMSLMNMLKSVLPESYHERFIYGDQPSGRMFFPRSHAPSEDQDEMGYAIDDVVKRNGYFVDIGLYYAEYMDDILQHYPEAKCVYLERDKEATIKSYMKKTEGKDHWSMNPDRTKYRVDLWDLCYPKFTLSTKEQNIGAYWDYYQGTFERLSYKYPDRMIRVRTEDLNDYQTYVTIMGFYGLPVAIAEEDWDPFHSNAS